MKAPQSPTMATARDSAPKRGTATSPSKAPTARGLRKAYMQK
jgi:hypothetical protein